MKKEKHYPPTLLEGQFHCPHCLVFAMQSWAHIGAKHIWGDESIDRLSKFQENLDAEWRMSKCSHCGKFMIWFSDQVIFPDEISVSEPNEDLSEDVKNDYNEAAKILNKSPRGAAALLRLALQKLLKQLGEKGDNINNDIKSLIGKGLNPTIQKGLDFVRVTGNHAVHPGYIDFEDDKQIAEKLFDVINFIAEKMITEQKEVEGLFETLPEIEKDRIEKRNNDL